MNPAAELLLSFCCACLPEAGHTSGKLQFIVQQKRLAVEQVIICRSKC